MNRQLKIWRDDFIKYYNKTSLMMRIIIGAAISFGVAYYMTNKIVKPQNAKLKEIVKKVEAQDPIDSADIDIADLQNKQRKATARVEGLKEANKELLEIYGTMDRNDTGKSILAIRSLLDMYDIRIASESRVVAAAPVVKKSRRSSKKPATVSYHINVPLPDSMGCDSYRFVVLGSYANIRSFLLAAYSSPALMFINNISISRSDELITDADFNQYQALSVSFEAHVPYKKVGK